jgi:esterase/lipase superfamily enzyme
MHREYHKWYSPRLGRDMELLVHGHAGLPVIVFPTSQGRFYEFEDRGMIASIGYKIDNGEVQLYCVDSVDAESWYNRAVPPRWRIARHMSYEGYITEEVLPLVYLKNWSPKRISLGASFGGYHAVNIALRHPDKFTGFLSMSGAFDLQKFLNGYHDSDVYFNIPPQYVPNLHDSWQMDRYRQNSFLFASGWDDHCLQESRHLAGILQAKGVPCRMDIWDTYNSHDWPTWQRMMQVYL